MNNYSSLFERAISDPDFYISASQLKTFSRCKRKWWYTYVQGVRPDSTEAQDIGREIHKQLENWFKIGAVPAHKAARESLTFLPTPNESICAELTIDGTLDGIRIRGQIDVLDLTNVNEPLIIDHKSMKTFEFAADEFDLKQDLQMLKYAAWVLEHITPGAESVRLAHNQIPRLVDAPPRYVEATVSKEYVFERWASMKSIVDEIAQVRVLEKAVDVEPNYDACDDYGGCFFRERCALAFTELNDESEVNMAPEVESERLTIEVEEPVTRSKSSALKKWEAPSMNKVHYLFINAIPGPGFGAYTTLAELLEPIQKQILKETGVSDYRLVEYGKGKGMVLAALRAIDLPDIIVVGREDSAALALEALIPRAQYIIQGV